MTNKFNIHENEYPKKKVIGLIACLPSNGG